MSAKIVKLAEPASTGSRWWDEGDDNDHELVYSNVLVTDEGTFPCTPQGRVLDWLDVG